MRPAGTHQEGRAGTSCSRSLGCHLHVYSRRGLTTGVTVTAFPEHGPQPSPQRESLGRTVLRTGAGTASSHQTPTRTPGSPARRPPGGGRRAAESWQVGCGASCGRLTRRPAAQPQTHIRESHGGRARPPLRPWEGPPCRHTPSPASSGRWLLLDRGSLPGPGSHGGHDLEGPRLEPAHLPPQRPGGLDAAQPGLRGQGGPGAGRGGRRLQGARPRPGRAAPTAPDTGFPVAATGLPVPEAVGGVVTGLVFAGLAKHGVGQGGRAPGAAGLAPGRVGLPGRPGPGSGARGPRAGPSPRCRPRRPQARALGSGRAGPGRDLQGRLPPALLPAGPPTGFPGRGRLRGQQQGDQEGHRVEAGLRAGPAGPLPGQGGGPPGPDAPRRGQSGGKEGAPVRLPPPPRGLVPRPPPVPYSFRPRGARFRPCWGSCAGSRVGVGTAPWSRSRAPPGRGPPGAAVLTVGSRRGARGGPHTGTANRGTRGLPWKAAGVRGARQGCRCLPRQAVPARPPPQSHASHVCSRATHQLLGVTVALRALGRGCLPP